MGYLDLMEYLEFKIDRITLAQQADVKNISGGKCFNLADPIRLDKQLDAQGFIRLYVAYNGSPAAKGDMTVLLSNKADAAIPLDTAEVPAFTTSNIYLDVAFSNFRNLGSVKSIGIKAGSSIINNLTIQEVEARNNEFSITQEKMAFWEQQGLQRILLKLNLDALPNNKTLQSAVYMMGAGLCWMWKFSKDNTKMPDASDATATTPYGMKLQRDALKIVNEYMNKGTDVDSTERSLNAIGGFACIDGDQ